MRKKGFTLIELLAAIIILALLTLIAIPAVSKQLGKSKNILYNNQLENIKMAAKSWGTEHIFLLPDDGCITLTLGYLKDNGFIDVEVKDPKTNESFDNNNTFVNITKENNQYIYEVFIGGNKCELVDEEISNN